MKIIWSKRAVDDLNRIVKYISSDNPEAARRVASTIYADVLTLDLLSSRGRPGKLFGTRELLFTPWPYIVVYKLVQDGVNVLFVRHGARQ